MYARIAAVAGASAAGLLLTAGAAVAGPATKTPPIVPVANTGQTLLLHQKKGNHYAYSAGIVFSTKTFTIPVFSDSGTFKNSGSTLILKVTKSQQGDRGCVYTGTYDSSTTYYSGTYTCPGGFEDTFAVTTDGT